MIENSYYSTEELKEIGFKKLGNNVLISRKCSIYAPQEVTISDNVRIDDFVVLSGKIDIGRNVHIAVSVCLFGGDAGITVSDFSGISARTCVYAVSDDYSGESLSNPTIPDSYRNIHSEAVRIEKHVLVGAGSVILPGTVLSEGTSIGAMSLCKSTTKPWTIYVGIPARPIKKRSNKLLSLTEKYLENNSN